MSILFSLLFLDNVFEHNVVSNYISRSEGFTIVLFFLIFIYYIIQVVQNKTLDREYRYKDEDIKIKYNISKAIPFTIIGLILVIFGAELVVENTALIAKAFGISERIITLFIIVPGTSLPEIVTSFISVSRKQYDLVVGNVIGSNIFNIGLALGLPAAVFGSIIPTQFRYLDLIVLILSSIMFYLFARNDRKIKTLEGIIMIILFLIYYFSVVFI